MRYDLEIGSSGEGASDIIQKKKIPDDCYRRAVAATITMTAIYKHSLYCGSPRRSYASEPCRKNMMNNLHTVHTCFFIVVVYHVLEFVCCTFRCSIPH